MAKVEFSKGNSSGLNSRNVKDGSILYTEDTTKLYIDDNTDRIMINPNPDWNASSGNAKILNKPGVATTSADGLMSSSDKVKLNGIADGAQVNTITGVKGNAETNYRTGNVSLTSANIGALPITGGILTGALAMRRPSGAPRIELFTLEKDGVGSAKTMLYKNADDSTDNGTTLADFVWGDGSANNKSVRLVLLAASAYPSNLIRLRYDDGAGNSTIYRIYGEHYKPPLADVTGLETALAGKSDTGHTHGAGDIISGTLPVDKGGTGQNTAKAAASALIVSLGSATANVQDGTLIATSDATGETNTWYKRPASAFWNYIKGKSNALYAALSHKHTATDIESGTLDAARLPVVSLSKGGTGETNALSAITALGGLSAGSIGTPMASGDNIDNYTTPGTYLSADATISASLQGTPPYTAGGFKLYVIRGYQSGVTIQLVQGASVTVYCRIKTSSTADWGNWQTYALGGHSHGSIRSDGSIGQDTTPEVSDRLVITDASDGNKIVRSSIAFDGTTTDKALTPKGTWRSFLPSNGGTLTGNLTINTQNTPPIIRLITPESETTKPGAATLGKNASSSVDYGTVISDYPLNSTAIDINNPHTALMIFHSNPLNNRLNLLDYSTDGNYQGYKIYGEHNKPTPEDIGAYPSTGGTLTGNVTISTNNTGPTLTLNAPEKAGVGRSRSRLVKNATSTSDSGTLLTDYVWGDGTNSNQRTQLQIKSSAASLQDRINLIDYAAGGSSTTYRLYGEHNKPAIADVTGLVDALASKSDTDTKAVHTETTVASNLPILLSYTTTPVSGTARGVYYNTNASIKPSTGDISTNGSISATGNITSSGNISGIINHESGYLVVKPFSSQYDSTGAGYCRIYYNHDNTDSGRIANSLIVGSNTTIISGKISSNGSLLTNLNGSAITTGTVLAARLGIMTGATSSANGTSGAVPAPPTSGYNTKYLRADGTWVVPPNNTYTAASAAPNMDGTATVGTSDKYAREDHIHPKDTTKLDVSNPSGIGYLKLSRNSSSGKTIQMMLQKNASDAADYGTQLLDYNTSDATKYTRLVLRNAAPSIDQSLYLSDGSGMYYIYGEHNKPYVTAGQKSGSTLGAQSTAEGANTTASGDQSHAEGANTTASGAYAHAEGLYTTASGQGSHAEGRSTTAAGVYQHVFGEYNTSNTTDVEIVGWGTSSTRKNIRTLDRSGNMTIAGTLTQSSDARLKDIEGDIPDVSDIRAVRFKWNDTNGEHDDKDHIGYIAQEVESVAPFLVSDDSNGYKSLDYIALLCAKVEMLERRVAELESR